MTQSVDLYKSLEVVKTVFNETNVYFDSEYGFHDYFKILINIVQHTIKLQPWLSVGVGCKNNFYAACFITHISNTLYFKAQSSFIGKKVKILYVLQTNYYLCTL